MKRPSAHFLLAAIASVFAGFLFGGCSTTESAAGKEVAEAPVAIEKGMSGADLVAALGEPDFVRPAEPPVDGTEIWVYRKRNVDSTLILSGTKETPYIDPITGQARPIIDNVYSNATTSRVEDTLFLMVDGVMTAWKVERSENVKLQN